MIWTFPAACAARLNGASVVEWARRRARPAIPHAFPAGGDPSLTAMAAAAAQSVAPPPLQSRPQFASWQEALRERLENELLSISNLTQPQRAPYIELAVDRLDCGVTRHALAIEAFDDTKLPAYLFVPERCAHAAGVLVLPGHVETDRESGLAQTAGLVPSYQHGAALELAKLGFVTLTFELRGFGSLGPPTYPEHRAVAHNAILAGTSYKAVLARDVKRAADVLLSRPEVDPSRFGLAGASFGGELATVYAAVDTRVGALAINSVTPPRGPFPAATGTQREQQPHYCHTMPGENAILLQEHWYYLIAPRPLLCVNGSSDSNPPGGNDDYLFTPYKAFALEAQYARLVLAGRGHEFFVPETAEFFRLHLVAAAPLAAAAR